MPRPEVLDVLKAARERYARNPSHARVGQTPEATCVVMAIDHSANGWYMTEVENLLAEAAGLDDLDTRMALIQWNAEATTDAVLAAFDRAVRMVDLDA